MEDVQKFTYERVLDTLRAIVAVTPDKVAEKFHVGTSYFGCRYLDPEGCPSCIVGVCLDRLGIPHEEISAMDTEARWVGGVCPQMVLSSKVALWGRFEYKARELLAEVQYQQDRGRMWGEALDSAVTVVS